MLRNVTMDIKLKTLLTRQSKNNHFRIVLYYLPVIGITLQLLFVQEKLVTYYVKFLTIVEINGVVEVLH
jgi:hypothetical protein